MGVIEPYHPENAVQLAQRVKAVTSSGGIVGLPTETFYGLAVDPFNARAVEALLDAKGRGEGKPILVLIGSLTQLSLLTEESSPIARLLMSAFWPGPLTILFPARRELPHNVTANTGTVGVRLSCCRPLIDILITTGPLTGTSANRSGEPPAAAAQDVMRSFGATVRLIVDAGGTAGGKPSTVIDPREPVRLVREGAISRQMIENVLETQGISLRYS
ncbi:putative dsRNA-binding protein, predicted ribosome maturation factor [Nitrospira sp. KM1]|nr:putative dsRNA-binding protein, predicted ribosome maturation factor [Nitrospira sp. KM1]